MSRDMDPRLRQMLRRVPAQVLERGRQIDDRRSPPAIRKLLVGSLPGKKAEDAAFFSRVAGGGSLGRPRFVVVATWRGGRVVREAKALVPSAWNWALGTTPRQHKYLELSTGAYRAPDPFLHVDRDTDDRDFVFRRLSADLRKIELDKDAVADLKLELLRAMGSDLASIHAATPDASKPIATDLKARGSRWLHDAARAAREATEKDFVRRGAGSDCGHCTPFLSFWSEHDLFGKPGSHFAGSCSRPIYGRMSSDFSLQLAPPRDPLYAR